VKTGTGSSYRRHFAEKPHFGVFFLRGTKLKYLSMFQFSTKMTNFWSDDSRHVCLQNVTKIFIQKFTKLICIIFKCTKFALKYLAKSSACLIDIDVLFDQIGDAEFKNGVKTGTGSSFRRHFGEKPNFRVSRPRISVIRLCSATTRPADRSVDRRHFGPPSWTGNRTAMPRRTDSDHAEC